MAGMPSPRQVLRCAAESAASLSQRAVARRKQRVRHGGGQQRVDLDSQVAIADEVPGLDILALDISLATAERQWTFARSWLYAELADGS
jgi:hypothetical protein